MPNNPNRAELQNVHDELFQEVAAIHLKWNHWQELFSDKATVALLNKTAAAFFALHQQVLIDDIALSTARLLDPAKTGMYKNLSLERLRDCVHAMNDSQLTTNFNAAFDDFARRTASVEEYRNKKIAHNDLETVRGVVRLPSVTVSDINGALDALRKTMNVVKNYLTGSVVGYERTRQDHGGIDAIVHWLNEGWAAEEQRRRADGLAGDSDPTFET